MSCTIGNLSRETGCHVETIRYYERIGLLQVPPRTAGGHRIYDEVHVRRLSFIRRTRDLGFPLNEVRSLVDCVDSGNYSCEEIRAMTVARLADVRREISELKRLEKTLKTMAETCDGGAGAPCAIVNSLNRETP